MPVAATVVGFCRRIPATTPYVVGKPLTNELAAYHSARRGAYRVAYTLNGEQLSVTDASHDVDGL